MVEDTYELRRKCAREQVLTAPVLSAILDTQVINRSGTADVSPPLSNSKVFFVFRETMCYEKVRKKRSV